MLRVVVCVSGGGTNLQAIIDAVADGTITNTELVGVISNNYGVRALERAEKAGIDAKVVSPRITRTVRHLMKDCLPQSGHISRI